MTEDWLSIIVPVYNTENYLPICLKSIISQDTSGVEVILINDGSTDNCPNICEEATKKYHFIRTITGENRGLSVARNRGLSIARNRYILFVDSDDELEDGILEDIKQCIYNNPDVQIIEFGYNVIRDGKNLRTNIPILPKTPISGKEYLSLNLDKPRPYEWFPWKYVFSREFLDEIEFTFPEGTNYEDVYTMPRAIYTSNRVYAIDKVGYRYRLGREGALTNNLKVKTEIQKLNVAVSCTKYFDDIAETDLKDMLRNSFSLMYYSALINVYAFQNKEDQNLLMKELIDKRWITNYTYLRPQVIVRNIMRVFGVKITARILGIRRGIKNRQQTI